MIPDRRRDYLLALLNRHELLSIAELVDWLDVSHMTVRRDIAALEADGRVLSVSGGVRLARRDRHDRPWTAKIDSQRAEKQAIADRAVGDVRDGMSIYLDAGTTTYEIARRLAGFTGLSVFTNNFHIAALLMDQPEIALFHTGGRIDRDNHAAVGPATVRFLAEINLDIAFVSAGAWHATRGLTTPDEAKIGLKQQLLASAARAVLVADSSKYGRFGMFRACGLAEFDALVTDAGLPEAEAGALREAGVALERAPLDRHRTFRCA